MTVSTTYAPLEFSGDDATVLFSVTWPFFDGTLVVTLVASDGTETVKSISTHYTVSGGTDSDGLPATGSVTMITAPASGETLRIERATTKTQTSTWSNDGGFQAKTLEATLDKILMIAQENYYNRDFDWRTAWATSTVYYVNDLVQNDNIAYICTASHTSAASTEPGVGGSWTSYWDLFASGTTGATGAAGADGSDGITAGLSYGFDSATSGDPGAGEFLLNNATYASVTAINISDTDADGNDVSAFIATWDDVSAAAGRGHLIIRDKSDTSAYAIYTISGTNADNTTYNTLTVTHVASAGTFAGPCAIEFYRSGADGGGSGDMVAATYDPANVAEQLVGLVASQTLTNKTLTSPTVNTPTLVLQDAAGAAPTTDGQIKYDRTGENLEVGDGSGTKTFANDTTNASTYMAIGKHTVWVLAGAMTSRTTNGAADGTTELTTNDIMLQTKDFDQTTEEGVGFMIGMPKSWNEGTVTFIPYWTAASGSGGVVWSMQAVAISNDDALDATLGTGQTSTDTLLLANDCHIGPESSAITIGGTPAENDLVYFEITRLTANGSDTLTADAKLIGVKLLYTTNAGSDA